MKRNALLGVAAVASALAVALSLSPTRAADHNDSEGPRGDPAADVADVFAWVPAPGRTALVMTLGDTFATQNSRFGPKIDYRFAVRNVASRDGGLAPTGAPRDIVCTSDDAPAQTVTCTTSSGEAKSFTVGEPPLCSHATDAICVWAGIRRDPTYVDLVRFDKVADAGLDALAPDGGADTLAFSSVLAIVLDVDTAEVLGTASFDAGPGATPTSVVAVAAETARRP